MLFVNFSYRVAVVFFTYMCFYWSFMLGDLGKSFKTSDWDHLVNPTSDGDNPSRYESLYIVSKPQKY